MDETAFWGYLGLGMILTMVVVFGYVMYQSSIDKNTKNTICNTLDLGNYINTGSADKTIDGQKYFKCTKEIYNSTTKEIITVEKWVRLP